MGPLFSKVFTDRKEVALLVGYVVGILAIFGIGNLDPSSQQQIAGGIVLLATVASHAYVAHGTLMAKAQSAAAELAAGIPSLVNPAPTSAPATSAPPAPTSTPAAPSTASHSPLAEKLDAALSEYKSAKAVLDVFNQDIASGIGAPPTPPGMPSAIDVQQKAVDEDKAKVDALEAQQAAEQAAAGG
jgi:hypothetical protein